MIDMRPYVTDGDKGCLRLTWSNSDNPKGDNITQPKFSTKDMNMINLWHNYNIEFRRFFSIIGFVILAGCHRPSVDAEHHSTEKPSTTLHVTNPSIVLDRFTGGILSIAFAPKGSELAVASRDSTINVLNAKNGRNVWTFSCPGVNKISFSPNGRMIAAAYGKYDNTSSLSYHHFSGGVQLWDVSTGKEINRFRSEDSNIYDITFSPNSECLAIAVGDSGLVQYWDIKTDRRDTVFEGHARSDTVHALAFANNGLFIAAGLQDGIIIIWDLKIRRPHCKVKGHSNSITSVCFSTDGKFFASASNGVSSGRSSTDDDHGSVKIWEIDSCHKLVHLSSHAQMASAVVFMPNSKHLLSGGDTTGRGGETIMWDVTSSKETVSFLGHSFGVSCLAISSDGTLLATGSEDKRVLIWNVRL